MREPAVTLTDYALAVECAAFAWLCLRSGGPLRRRYAVFFATLAAAAVVGGTSHGFCPDETTLGYRLLWLGTLLSLGATAFSMWWIAAGVVLPARRQRLAVAAAAFALAAYAAVVLAGRRAFVVAIAFYLPPALAMLAAFAVALARSRDRRWAVGVVGVLGTFAAAAIQTGRIALGPLDHNASYHLVQGLALIGIVATRSARTGTDAAGQ